MKLNKLSYRTIEQKDEFLPELWFELIVDGESIEKFIGEDKAIPYYYFEDDGDDLPFYINTYHNKKLHFLGVCSCGSDGCGHRACEVEKDESFVNIQVFFYGSYKPQENIEFRFSRENYDFVISEIRKRSKEYKKTKEIK